MPPDPSEWKRFRAVAEGLGQPSRGLRLVSGGLRHASGPLRAAAHRIWRKGFWRTGVAALVVGGVCGWQFVFAGSGTAAADTSSWVPGSANTLSQALSLAPSTAGLNYALTLATSIADYQSNEGQAEAQSVNGGPLATAATSQQCNGQAPAVQNSQLPQPALAESTNGNKSSSNDFSSQYKAPSGPFMGTGTEHASATTQPSGNASSKMTDFSVPGLFDVSGLQSTGFAQEVTGKLRQATSSSDIADVSLAGGKVQLQGLRWQSTQETGPGGKVQQQQGSFSLGGLTIGGKAVPGVSSDSLTQLTDTINGALAQSGLHVTMPHSQTNSVTNGETMPPMSIGIDQSALGQQVVGPGLAATETVRDAIQSFLENADCQFGIPFTVVDLLVGTLSGGGNLDLKLGGAMAASEGTAYANPFGNSLGLLGAGGNGALLGNGAGGTGGSPGSPPVAGSYTPGTPGTPGTPESSGKTGKAALGSFSKSAMRCESRTLGHFVCGNSPAVPVSLVGLAVMLGVGAADYTRLRRHRRLSPDALPR